MIEEGRRYEPARRVLPSVDVRKEEKRFRLWRGREAEGQPVRSAIRHSKTIGDGDPRAAYCACIAVVSQVDPHRLLLRTHARTARTQEDELRVDGAEEDMSARSRGGEVWEGSVDRGGGEPVEQIGVLVRALPHALARPACHDCRAQQCGHDQRVGGGWVASDGAGFQQPPQDGALGGEDATVGWGGELVELRRRASGRHQLRGLGPEATVNEDREATRSRKAHAERSGVESRAARGRRESNRKK